MAWPQLKQPGVEDETWHTESERKSEDEHGKHIIGEKKHEMKYICAIPGVLSPEMVTGLGYPGI